MKKIQIKTCADLFGKQLPLGKIKNAATRKEIILLATSLRKAGKEVDDDIESIRARLTEGHEEEVKKWADLTDKIATDTTLSDEEKKKLADEAAGYKEAVRISEEYREAVNALFNEEISVPVHKVDIMVVVDALVDAGMLAPEASVDAVMKEFEGIIA